jgi:NitT/TauT family transport system substrate-binding protein
MALIRSTRSFGLLAALTFGLNALVLTPAISADSKLTHVVLRTDYRFNGWISPFSLAVERNYYRDLGLDVEIAQGSGSAITLQTVGSGADDFGLSDSSTVLLGVSAQDIPVVITSVYLQAAVIGLIYHASSGFSGDLHTLRGRPVVSSAGVADLTLLQPVLNTAGMTLQDVDLRLVDLNARIPLFLHTPNAVLTGFAGGDFLRAKLSGADVGFKPYSDYGIVGYSTGLIAQRKTIDQQPGLVQKMVTASAKGWEDAIKDPDAAVRSALKLFPELDGRQLSEGLKIVLADELHTPATKGHPLGWTADSDWVSMINVLARYSKMNAKPPSYYYTNRFIVPQ